MSNIEAMQRALTDVVTKGDFVVPPYPAVAMRLQRVLAREGYGISEVADVVAADAALAATVLAAANSALLGSAAAITSVGRAVNRLGARTVGAIALASGVGALAVTSGVLQDVKFRVWRRGITCALTCQKLAAARDLPPEDAFLAGLLHGFGRSVAVASLERLLKTHQPPRPLTVTEWLNIADQQRAALAHAVAQIWQLPTSIARAMDPGAVNEGSPLSDLVLYADQFAGELDAQRLAPAAKPTEARLIDELIAGLPAALEAFAPPTPQPTARPGSTALVAKPERALDGELRKTSLRVVDRRSKGAAELKAVALAPTGIQVDSSRPFQESSMVRLGIGEPQLDSWFNVVLCVPNAARYRVELELFSPTRETRERWRALFEAP